MYVFIESMDVFANIFEITFYSFQLGMTDMFADNADLSDLLETGERLKVSDVIHKAFITVSEGGTEAAAATGNLF